MRQRQLRSRAQGLLCLLALFVVGLAHAAPPAAPTNPSPGDGSTGVSSSPSVCVDVSDPEGDPLDVTFFGRPTGCIDADDFAIILLPDTQYYSESYPQIFDAQTEWIAHLQDQYNVVFTTHVGDCVQNGSDSNTVEWDRVDNAMSFLENDVTAQDPDGLPYGIAVGNHDQSPFGEPGTTADPDVSTFQYNSYFGVSRFSGREYYGGHYGTDNDNHYQLFSAGGMEFIILHLEYMQADIPLRQSVLQWADDLLTTYSDRRAIVTSHFLQNRNGTWSNQGFAVYEALKGNPNLFLMLTGHITQAGRRTDTFGGNTVYTIRADYQNLPEGGQGFLRLLKFSPSSGTIDVEAYSPWRDEWWLYEPHTFSLPYDMCEIEDFASFGSVGAVPSGSMACVDWTGLEEATTYEWYAESFDGTATAGPVWSLESDGSCVSSSDCDDGDPCTAHSCGVGGVCEIVPIADCCLADGDCDDGNRCTDDNCNLGTNLCDYLDNSLTCDDGNSCTGSDVCSGGTCSGTTLACGDASACTTDYCSQGVCYSDFEPQPGCCSAAIDCDDGDSCTIDSCDGSGACVNDRQPADCCDGHEDCSGGDRCIAGTCTPDRDDDRLIDDEDPCPDDPRNLCFGPVAADATEGRNLRINGNHLASDECAGVRVDCNGDTWESDFGYAFGRQSTCGFGGGAEGCVIGGIDALFGCTDPEEQPNPSLGDGSTEDLFQCTRWVNPSDPDLVYTFDVPDGTYLINLFYAATSPWNENPGTQYFDVVVEGQLVYDDLDPLDEAGATRIAIVRSLVTEVVDGNGLEIRHVAVEGNPALKALEVLEQSAQCALATECDDLDPCTADACVVGICQNELFADGDADGVCDLLDCASGDPSTWSLPGEVTGLGLDGIGKSMIGWTPPAELGALPALVSYDTLRSSDVGSFTTGTTCIETADGSDLVSIDPSVPSAGQAFQYVVRARNGCGAGTVGSGSEGAERTAAPCP